MFVLLFLAPGCGIIYRLPEKLSGKGNVGLAVQQQTMILGLIIGAFLGSVLGVCVMALISVSGDSKEK